MYGYNVRGWKSSGSTGIAETVTAGHYQPTVKSPSSASSSSMVAAADQPPRKDYPKCIIKEEDEMDGAGEENDVAAPLPSELLTSVHSDGHSGDRQPKVFAKDKRRLREKRRSTGVATLVGQEADEETTRNTSYNEIAASEAQALAAGSEKIHQPDLHLQPTSSPFPSTTNSSANGGDCLRSDVHTNSHNHLQHQGPGIEPVSPSRSLEVLRLEGDSSQETSESSSSSSSSGWRPLSSDFSRNYSAKPFEPKRGILKSGKPATMAKPEKPVNFTTSASQRSSQQCQRSPEEIQLQERLAEMEKFVDAARRENGALRQMLTEKDSKIRDLELQIVTLNEDLDLADEDYMQLEEENRALARALAQLNSTLITTATTIEDN